MKKIFVLAVIAAAMMLTSCGSAKKVSTVSRSPFGTVSEVPAAEHDTDEYFGATGIATGSYSQMGRLQLAALENAKEMIRQKVEHSFQTMTTSYLSEYSGKNGSDLDGQFEQGTKALVEAVLKDVNASKGPFFSDVDEKGNVTCFIGIRIPKNKLVDLFVDNVSEQGKLALDFKKDQFMKQMKEEFNKFNDKQ